MSTGNIGKIKASRVNNVPNVNAYIGEKGILFYNYANGVIRMSDGITPGGVPIPYTVATSDVVGGIKAGPGANIAADGSLTIDTAGLPLSIGDLDIFGSNISTVNANEDLNLLSNGTGSVNIVGNLHVHTTAQGPDYPTPILEADDTGNVTINGNLITNGGTFFIGDVTQIGNLTITGKAINNGVSEFNGNLTIAGNARLTGSTFVTGNTTVTGTATLTGNSYIIGNTVVVGTTTVTGNITVTGNSVQTGQASYIVSTNSSNTGAVEITGNTQGLFQPPALPGVMLHVTGQDNGTTPGRVYVDANRQYPIIVGRRYNGSIASPTQAVAGDEVLRLAGTGYPTGGWPLTGLAQIRFIADENQTQTNRGGHIDFLTVPIGSNVVTQVMSLSATTGANISGNLIASNLNVSGTISGHYTHSLRDAGTIVDGGTITLDFVSDDIVVCVWNNGLNVAYTNFIPGRSVRLIAQKGDGSGTDTLNLDGISANHTSTGSTTISAAAGQSYIIEFYSTNSSIAGLYAKL